MNPLKIAVVHQIGPKPATSSWRGVLRHQMQALEQFVGDPAEIEPAPLDLRPYRASGRLLRLLSGRSYSPAQDPAIARQVAAHFSRRLARGRYDLVFAPAASAIVAYLDTDLPIVLYNDATWRLLREYHGGHRRPLPFIDRGGEEIEARAIERADLLLYPTRWAARSAVEHYGADISKVHVTAMGANLPYAPARSEVLPRSIGVALRLLMVGVNWEGKGGPIALATLQRLLALGYDARLTVVGCRPPRGVFHPHMHTVPFLDTHVPGQWRRMAKLWHRNDFMILPTRFEAAGLVFCEASAFGLPSVTCATGGVASIVRDGINGYTLPATAGPDDYAAVIADLADDPERYERLAEAARNEFEARLNWNTWGERVADIIGDALPGLRERIGGHRELQT